MHMISSFHIVTVCGGAAGYGMCVCTREGCTHTYFVKGRLFRANTTFTLPFVWEKYHMCLKLSKNPISFLSGDGETWLCFIISGPEMGIRVRCQSIQQYQGSHERIVSFADKTENIFLRNSMWRFYHSSPGQNVYLSVSHSKQAKHIW